MITKEKTKYKHKIIVVDLDNTLVNCNTFLYWVLFISLKMLLSFRIIRFFKILKKIVMRRMKRVTHSQMKFHFLQTTNEYHKKRTIGIYTFFIIHLFLNKKVYRRITKDIKNKKHIVLLATAAPDCYAKKIAGDLKLDGCIASPGIEEVKWEENLKETKLKNVLNYIKKKYNTKDIGEVYTDHEDDFPLIKKAKKVFLVNPDQSLIEILEKGKIAFSIILKK